MLTQWSVLQYFSTYSWDELKQLFIMNGLTASKSWIFFSFLDPIFSVIMLTKQEQFVASVIPFSISMWIKLIYKEESYAHVKYLMKFIYNALGDNSSLAVGKCSNWNTTSLAFFFFFGKHVCFVGFLLNFEMILLIL